MDNILNLIGRSKPLLDIDIKNYNEKLNEVISTSSFLVIGGAGSIGSALSYELFKRCPRILHIVDISENNMVELVRNIRSSIGYSKCDFATYALDCGSYIYDSFIEYQTKKYGKYDYILNFSALKHVRSEKDPFTLMRLIDTNIFNTIKTAQQATSMKARKYFCVSTDKAANPVNMMGASKRIMEMFLMKLSLNIPISTARFANVAFSDGSLLYGFKQRLEKNEPLSAPKDIRRYFVTPTEAGQLCLMSVILGENRDIFFPKLSSALNLITFSEIAINYLHYKNYEPYICENEEEARTKVIELKSKNLYPVYFFNSDTTGEKDFEEFYTVGETLDMSRFDSLGIIKNNADFDSNKLNYFTEELKKIKENGLWTREKLIDIFNTVIPNFNHKEKGKFLDQRM